MKKLSFLLFFLLFTTLSYAQLGARIYSEVTHVSPKIGAVVTYSIPGYIGDIALGGFYQQSATAVGDPNEPMQMRYEEEFFGLFTSFTVLDKQVFELDVDIRTGMANNSSFVITPSVMGNLKLGRHVKLNAGIGTRCFRPSYLAGLSVTF